MPDIAHEQTNKLLKELEQNIAEEYRIAVADMQQKLADYLEKTEAQRKVQEALYQAGEITKQDYQNWCFRHNMMGKRWEEMRDVLASDMHHTNEVALGMTKDRMPDVYALNGNYGTYQIEHDARIDTGFTLYNHDTAEYLLGDQRQLMPKPSARKAAEIAANKDMQWNKQKIQSAVLQGVLQGESPYKVAERLRMVGQMNYNASVRYARTMTTSAQNAGRYESYRRATKLGVDLTIEWQATLDDRTRDHHRAMHGERTTVDEPFYTPDGYTIYYPADCTGDSDAPQREIWNCRCTLLAWVKGFEGDTVKDSPKMGDKSFEEWQEGTKAKQKEVNHKVKYYDLDKAKSGFTFGNNDVTLSLPDIFIPRSLGAKRSGEKILDLATGNEYDLADGTYLRKVTVFAGKGTNTPYINAWKYADRFHNDESEWQHVKGIGTVATEDGDRDAELHWSQCDMIGRVDMFVKKWLDWK